MGNGELSLRDLRGILEFLRVNYTFGDHQAFISNVVHGLPRLMPADLTAHCEIDPVAKTSTNWLDRPEVDTPEAQRTWESFMLEMPILAHYIETGDGRALRITDFVSQRQFRQTGVYSEHYRPKDLEYVLATWVPSKRSTIGVGVQRRGRDYTERERAMLEMLRPHLIQGWRNTQLATRLCHESETGRILGTLHPDLVVLDRRGQPLFVGDRARELLVAHFPSNDHPERVPEEILRWAHWLTQQFAERADDLPLRCAPLEHQSGRAPLLIRPFVRESGMILAFEERIERDPERLKVLGLSAREAEVLTWVAEGKTNQDIAAILHLAPKTVEKHLEVASRAWCKSRAGVGSLAHLRRRSPPLRSSWGCRADAAGPAAAGCPRS